jgi:gliding motility-associated-like protein
LSVTSNEGCGTAYDNVRVYVYPDVYVPNAFSPNNDGINDTWSIPALRAWNEYSVSVYNRYGQLVFYTKNAAHDWDGRFKGILQPVGAYVYYIDLKNGEKLLKGTVSIVR